MHKSLNNVNLTLNSNKGRHRRMKRTIPALLIIAIMITSGGLYAAKKAPGFALMNNKGKFVYKSRLRGNLLIAFWASFCAPCKKEMPHLIQFEKKYAQSKGLKLILINVDKNDTSGNAKDKAEKTLAKLGISHDYLIDLYHMALQNYNPKKTVPATYLVNRYGYIVFSATGNSTNTINRLEAAIKKLR